MLGWPLTREELIEEQARLAALRPAAWRFEPEAQMGGVFVCFARGESGPGQAGDPAWAAACIGRGTTMMPGHAGASYEPGLLALREASEGEDGLAGHAQFRARRDQDLDLRGCLEDHRHYGGTTDEIFEVVEDEQLALGRR